MSIDCVKQLDLPNSRRHLCGEGGRRVNSQHLPLDYGDEDRFKLRHDILSGGVKHSLQFDTSVTHSPSPPQSEHMRK